MVALPTELVPLTAEQQEIIAPCLRIGAEQIGPDARTSDIQRMLIARGLRP